MESNPQPLPGVLRFNYSMYFKSDLTSRSVTLYLRIGLTTETLFLKPQDSAPSKVYTEEGISVYCRAHIVMIICHKIPTKQLSLSNRFRVYSVGSDLDPVGDTLIQV